ncbi:MAG: inositol monophosphatase family protein [Sphingomonadaceae bacterium]
MSLSADIALIQRLADAARAAIAPHFRTPVDVERKADLSPVTIADRAAEAAMRKILQADRPQDGIIGEEYGAQRSMSGRIWVLDPIDGTRSFIAGRPLYGTLIGLLEGGRPRLGLIDAGATGDRWLGVLIGKPQTTLNGRPVKVRACSGLADAHGATTSPQLFTRAGYEVFQRVAGQARDMLYGGDCHNYGLMASGYLDFVIEEGLQVHDWAALVPVIEGAGGLVTDWQGRSLTLASNGEILASGDQKTHAEILAQI